MRDVGSEDTYPFLGVIKNNYMSLRKDFFNLSRILGREELVVSSTAKSSIRSRRTDWKAFAFVIHGKAPHEHMRDRGFLLPGMTTRDLDTLARAAAGPLFRHSRHFLSQLASDPANGIISMWYSCFEPGTKLGLHVNNDPYMYRAHVGLVVPEGNLGFKVRDEIMTWKEGEVLVFDPTLPHTAWNLTDKPRVVFIVDFFRPEQDRTRMVELERAQFERMMSENPLSFGMSGGYHELDEETVGKYAVAGIG
jgi:hypothetical protein